MSRDKCVAAERPGLAEDVYYILMENVKRGQGETSLREIFDDLRRKNDKLESEKRELESRNDKLEAEKRELESRNDKLEAEKRELENRLRVWSKKYKELDQRVLQLENESDCGSTRCGNDSKGDGSSPIVVLIESDDDCSGPSQKLSGDKHCGRRNDEKGKKELKRKRGLFSSAGDELFTQTLRGMAAALKQCEQENVKEKDSDNSLSKSIRMNPIKHGNGAGSASAKSDDESSSQKARWEYEADMLCDLNEDDELCMKAVCALFRQQRSKSMERTACQGFDGLLSPRGNSLAEFLTGGDPEGKLKKSVMDLRKHCPKGLSDCRSIAIEHTEQLFIMYQKKEDPFFPS